MLKLKVCDQEKLCGIPYTFVKVLNKFWPTFSHFSAHKQKLTKLRQYCFFEAIFTIFFLKLSDFYRLLWEIVRFYNSQLEFTKLTTFHKISVIWHYTFKVLCWLSVLLLVLSKDDSKIPVSFVEIQNFEVSNFVMSKVQKVNIVVTSHALLANVNI